MDVPFEPRNPVFAQTGSRTFTKGASHDCFRRMDKLDFRYILSGCVNLNSITRMITIKRTGGKKNHEYFSHCNRTGYFLWGVSGACDGNAADLTVNLYQ
jgi:hypothetical protein